MKHHKRELRLKSQKMNDTQHILSLSYGKDSLACLGAIEKLGLPLDRIVTVEVWATDTIPADLPPMMDFKAKADGIIKERWGITVEHIRDASTYERIFYRTKSAKAKHRLGLIYGWPFTVGAWCNSKLKIRALRQISKDAMQYLGIAADEPKRIARHSKPGTILPLVEVGWTEADCRKWCEENDLLSPIYTTATRGGCWFCHNQPIDQLRLLRRNYPDYWALLLKWDKDSPVTFHSDGHTVRDFEQRFALEDEGFLSADDKIFRWSMLDRELNRRWF